MRLDHLLYAAGPEGLDAAAAYLAHQLGAELVDGGYQPRFGTRNRILPIAGHRYLEVVEALDHPSVDKVAFAQAVRARSEAGGGWLCWVVAVDDLGPVEARLGRRAIEARHRRPDGGELRWRQVGVNGHTGDPQLPFVVCWESPAAEHPSNSATIDRPTGVELIRLEIGGNPHRLAEWLGEPDDRPLDAVEIDWAAPHGQPGIQAAHFRTRRGLVRI